MWKILALPAFFALFGFIFTTYKWILFTDKLTPGQGLLVYYIVIFVILFTLQYFGLIIADIEFKSFNHLIGSLLIWFSFFVLFDFSSCWTNWAVKGNCDSVPNVFMQKEDGATYYFWSHFSNDPEKIRLLTYVITPFLLTLVGVLMIKGKVSMSIF